METNDFDRSDFQELLGYMERFRKMAEAVQEKTDSFCGSFVSGISKMREVMAKFNFTSLTDWLDKAEGKTNRLNQAVARAGEQLTEKVIGNGEAAVSGLASVSEMVYRVLDTVSSLPRIRHLKISTDAEENRAALEGVIGTGERMKDLFDELEANPLLEKMGLEKNPIGKLRSRWEVLNKSKEDIAALMAVAGKGMTEIAGFREGWRTIRDNKAHSLKGFGTAVKTIFKKEKKTPEEKKEKNGFFSIFRKKEEGDENWFTAVSARFGEWKERTRSTVVERLSPLADYGTRIAGAYSPLFGMAGNVLQLKKLSGDFIGQAHMTALKAAQGWGIGDKARNTAAMDRITSRKEEREKRLSGELQERDEWKGMIFGLSAPPIDDKKGALWGGNPATAPVTVQVGRLIENLTIQPATLTEGTEEMRNVVLAELSRILSNANNLVMV